MEDHPGDAEGEESRVADGVGLGGEVELSVGALLPLGGEPGRDGGLATVLGEVGDSAAEGDGAKGLGVFAVFVHVFGVEGEEGVRGRVVAAPEEGLHPGVGVLLRAPGELEMLGGGEGLALHVEHRCGECEEDDDGDCCERGTGCGGVQALAGFEGELGEGGAEQERHDRVDEEVDAQRLHASDEMRAAALVREAEDDQGGDATDGDAGAAEGGCGVVERVWALAVAEEQGGEDGEGADESEELEPLPLGEEPVVAGLLRGDDGWSFGGGEGVENGGERESGEGEDGVGEISLAQASEAQNDDEAEGVGRHQRMEGCGEDEGERGIEERAERGAVVECEGHGQQGERRGEAARGDVGIHQEQRGAGDGERPEGCEQAEAGELCGFVGDRALQDAVGCIEGETQAEEVGEQQNPGQREVGEMDEESEYRGEDGEVEVLADEDGVVREERGVEGELDAGNVEAAVLG